MSGAAQGFEAAEATHVDRPRVRWVQGEAATWRRRFAAARRIATPRVLRVLDLVDDGDGRIGWVTEPPPGRTLAERLALRPSLTERLGWVADVAEALGFAHAHGLTHGALSAEQIGIDADGRAVLLDLGLGPESIGAQGSPDQDLMALGRLVRAIASPQELATAPRALPILVEALTSPTAQLRPSGAFVVMDELREIAARDDDTHWVPGLAPAWAQVAPEAARGEKGLAPRAPAATGSRAWLWGAAGAAVLAALWRLLTL